MKSYQYELWGNMTPDILKAYREGRLMLLLGAGASVGSKDSNGKDIPLAKGLAEELATGMGWTYNDEELGQVYSAINDSDSAKLQTFFRKRVTNCVASDALRTIASYPWPRVYTLNVDDCFENAARKANTQSLRVFYKDDSLDELDPIFKELQLVKLNGSADRLSDGFIFSPQEYGAGASQLPPWYRELGQNYSNHVFLFIGSRLNEPLFQHALAEMRKATDRATQRGYVLTPNATDIEKRHLESLNLQHVSGSLEDFAKWLDGSFKGKKPTNWDLAISRRPELGLLGGALTEKQMRILNSVTAVNADYIRNKIAKTSGKIRNFYKGYKPEWSDILDAVPADLDFVKKFRGILKNSAVKKKCLALVGQAGSGKTTAMMMAALDLSHQSGRPVYFLREPVSNIKEIILSLEELNDDIFYLFIDKADPMRNELAEALSSSQVKNVSVIISERINIWNRRLKELLEPVTSEIFTTEKITREDSKEILKKLEKYGPWTHLESLKSEEREKEIYNKSGRQLLIGLMEATTGLGFTEIIKNDFVNIGDKNHRMFFMLVGLSGIHGCSISATLVGRALGNLGVKEDTNILSSQVEGIVLSRDDKFTARHSLYVREIFEKIVDPDELKECIIALLKAFSDYKTPVIKNVGKSDGVIFRSITNHRFISWMMKKDENRVISIYEEFETIFHTDGQYWLQYGLALRGFSRHEDALEKLRTARQAYHSPQIEHAYAQQLMIIIKKKMFEWNEAEPLLNEAIEIFEKLDTDRGRLPEDTYPIVTLAEEHIAVVQKFEGIEKARKIANQYGNRLLTANKNHPSERLQTAATKVVSFATGGTWDAGTWNENSQLNFFETDE